MRNKTTKDKPQCSDRVIPCFLVFRLFSPSYNYLCHPMGVRDALKIQKMKICPGTNRAETHNWMTKNVREPNYDQYDCSW